MHNQMYLAKHTDIVEAVEFLKPACGRLMPYAYNDGTNEQQGR
jgi:hypothetical protein